MPPSTTPLVPPQQPTCDRPPCPAPLHPSGVGVADSPSALYHAMHSYLAGCGVDGVKVDCQAGVGLVSALNPN